MSLESENRSFREVLASNTRAVVLGIVALTFLVAACAIAIVLIRQAVVGDGIVSGDPTPTPFPVSEDSIGEAMDEGALVVAISGTDTISVSLDIPIALNLGGERFAVRTEPVGLDGSWQPELEGERSAVWVYGSVVNYVVGIQDTAANQSLVNQLSAGEEIILSSRNGVDLTFKFSDRMMVDSEDSRVFSQHTPGLTVVLVGGEGDQRIVVKSRYVVPEASSSRVSSVVKLGETAQLDDLQLTVTGASHLLDRPEAPPGFAFFMVDYQLQNIGLTAFDTSGLQLLLLDELGNQYALSPASTPLGNHQPLIAFLNSGQVVEATAGYQIPIGLNSSALSWVVTRSDTGGQVHVTIPFSGGAIAGLGTDVRLLRAEISQDLTSLVLSGQVTNLAEQPILVGERDVTLRTADGSVYLLLATNPPFPWTVPGSQSTQFQVTFQRPLASDTAIFTVLNQPFELQGLR